MRTAVEVREAAKVSVQDLIKARAAAIEKHLALTEQAKNIEGERQHHELVALSQISAALSGLWDLDAILRVALDKTLSIMNGTIGGILLLDEQTQTLSYRVHKGLSTKYVEEMHLNLGEGIAGRVAKSGKSVLLEDISAEPGVAYPDLVGSEGLKAFIGVPLRASTSPRVLRSSIRSQDMGTLGVQPITLPVGPSVGYPSASR